MTEVLGRYQFDMATRLLREFTWNEFCDWYLELSKPILQDEASSDAERRGTRRTLVKVLETLLRLLHPVMPFITEAIWQRAAPLAGTDGKTIMNQDWPAATEFPADEQAESELEGVRGFVLGVRQIRGEMSLLAYHLPLDRHLEVGNNAVAGRRLGLEEIEPFGLHDGLHRRRIRIPRAYSGIHKCTIRMCSVAARNHLSTLVKKLSGNADCGNAYAVIERHGDQDLLIQRPLLLS